MTPMTPNENADEQSNSNSKGKTNPSTPSPQCVDEFYHSSSEAITSANRSDIVSRMLSDHLVTVNDDEVIVSSTTVTLPELEEATSTTTILMENNDESEAVANNAASNTIGVHNRRRSSNHDMPSFARSSSSSTATTSPLVSTPKNNNHNPRSPTTPTSACSSLSTAKNTNNNNDMVPIQHKLLYQCVSSFASPLLRTTQDQHHLSNLLLLLHVGQEREVLFHTDSLGIKLSRHTDGYVRVLSVTPYRSNNDDQQPLRTGEIYAGDVVREVCGVDLRHPIDSAVWKMTVGLMKMAPRPLQFVVARELPKTMEEEENNSSSTSWNTNTIDPRFGPTRDIHFLESCLGVKLHHSNEGYVQILSVTPYKSFPNSPLARIGEVYAGDVVLQVGGVWDLREPIDDTTWSVLIKFIRETRRPLSMVVADGDCLEAIPQQQEQEEEMHVKEEDGEVAEQSTTDAVESSDATLCVADQYHQGHEDNEDSERSRSDGELLNVCKSMNEQTIE